ncbi:DUF3427 domain-containing protein [Corticicoccus populi]|uniref:DUF3427 domain-containing protein n=1 Tax=Corticicoccus populi TaxID=1812821 RepID=A0ABW5WWB3_9STAP
MENVRDNLLNAYERGFIDRNTNKTSHYPPELIINNPEENVLSPMLDALESCESFMISVAFITEGGLASLKTSLYELNKRGVRGQIITSTYLNFNKPKVFKELLKIPNIDVKITDKNGFHGKGYIFDNSKYSTMFIGSSNLTDTALKKNYEYNLKLTSLDNGEVIRNFKGQFNELWDEAVVLTEDWIRNYESIYNELNHDDKVLQLLEARSPYRYDDSNVKEVKPNLMQVEALESLKHLRATGADKGLIISATGTGKTFLSAFDVKQFKPQRVLFIAHREQILAKSMEDYRGLLGGPIEDYGIYSGSRKNREAKYLFATIQTLSKEAHLKAFDAKHFDYIIIDEAHRSGANSYFSILNYFEPEFLLGMTATPERTDDADIFGLFDYNIAYEIRLQKALEAEILSPFHYFGVTDYEYNGEVISDDSPFESLVLDERIEHISEKLGYYSHAGDKVRGLMFVSNRKEASVIENSLNKLGYKTKSLTGMHSQEERQNAVKDLEGNRLDYLITVDIFNEGVDIPSVNQVVMLRQTESSIIFVQQLGRGLRKHEGKEFLTVIDFIGNYKNNYLIPVALTGDKSFNKDKMRKDMIGRNMISGVSTINFEKVAKEKIYKAISVAKVDSIANLKKIYYYVKNKLGHIPSLVDLSQDADAINPLVILNKFNHYVEFLEKIKEPTEILTTTQHKILTFLSKEIVDGKRITEVKLIQNLLKEPVNKGDFQRRMREDGYHMNDQTLNSILRMLTLDFYTEQNQKKYGIPLINIENNIISLSDEFRDSLEGVKYASQVQDILEVAEINSYEYDQKYPLTLNEKYGRKDVCRLLNWDNDETSTMYGYKQKHGTLPIFITYHKSDEIEASISYEDKFLDTHILQWFTRSNRTKESPEIKNILMAHKEHDLPIYIFVKRDDDEGKGFYYLGNAKIDEESVEQTKMNGTEKKHNVVKMNLMMTHPLEQNLYRFFEEGHVEV